MSRRAAGRRAPLAVPDARDARERYGLEVVADCERGAAICVHSQEPFAVPRRPIPAGERTRWAISLACSLGYFAVVVSMLARLLRWLLGA